MAWAFITGSIPPSAWVLFAGTWAWTIWYDTIYACQDKKDDVKAGVKSTALLFGNSIKLVLASFAAIMMTALVLVGILNNHQLPYFMLSVGGGSAYLAVQLYAVDTDSPKSCWAAVRLDHCFLCVFYLFIYAVPPQWVQPRRAHLVGLPRRLYLGRAGVGAIGLCAEADTAGFIIMSTLILLYLSALIMPLESCGTCTVHVNSFRGMGIMCIDKSMFCIYHSSYHYCIQDCFWRGLEALIILGRRLWNRNRHEIYVLVTGRPELTQTG